MRQMKLIIAALFLISPFAANADPIEYTYSDLDVTNTWSYTLSLIFDTVDVVADTDIGASIQSWAASWTDGSTTYSTDSTLEGLSSSSFFVDSGGFVYSTGLCSGPCSQADHPEFFQGDVWQITFADASFNTTDTNYELWTSQSVSVSEPGILALLGIGLFGMGLARRRKTA